MDTFVFLSAFTTGTFPGMASGMSSGMSSGTVSTTGAGVMEDGRSGLNALRAGFFSAFSAT